MAPKLPLIGPAPRLTLTAECHHYDSPDEVPWDIQKYFSQRYSIFEYYDDGIYMTDDAWFGVTPEPVARKVANDISNNASGKRILLDTFAGAGGNTIAFALSGRWDRIISIERDAATLACAQNNAEVYQVDPDIITWIHGDSFEVCKALCERPDQLHSELRIDPQDAVLFASPPWGGPGYRTDEVFDLSTMQPYNLESLREAYKAFDHALYLPRTSDIRQIAKLVPDTKRVEVVQYCMDGASKAMVAYLPGMQAG